MDQRVLIICGDLFFLTQLRAEAERAGATVVAEMQTSRGIEQARAGDFRWVIVDLEAAGLDVPALLAQLPQENRPQVVAFGPHVQVQRLEAARKAGCNQVVSRGRIASSLAGWLRAGVIPDDPLASD